MGIDLTLLPIEGDNQSPCYSETNLNCFRRNDLFEAIRALPSFVLGRPLNCHFARLDSGECCYDAVEEDDYGDPLRYVKAIDLWPLSGHQDVLENRKNMAILAYLCELEAETKIVLFWK